MERHSLLSAIELKLLVRSAISAIVKTSSKGNNKSASDKFPDNLCIRCNEPFSRGHMKKCKAMKAKCESCGKVGHFVIACRRKDTNSLSTSTSTGNKSDSDDDVAETLCSSCL